MFWKNPWKYFFWQLLPSGHVVMIPRSNFWFCLGWISLGFLVVGWCFVFSNDLCMLGSEPLNFAIMLRANEGRNWVASWSVVLQGVWRLALGSLQSSQIPWWLQASPLVSALLNGASSSNLLPAVCLPLLLLPPYSPPTSCLAAFNF